MKTLILVVSAAVAVVSQANAIQITGGISFAGDFTPDDSDLTAATEIEFGNTFVTSSAGDLAVPALTPVTMTSDPLGFPIPAGNITNPLWTVDNFSYDLATVVVIDQDPDSLVLRGTGVIKNAIDGFEDTPGTWIATFNTTAETFSWSASAGAVNLSDAGSTLLFLGIGFAAARVYRFTYGRV